jgi:hypothetical protein
MMQAIRQWDMMQAIRQWENWALLRAIRQWKNWAMVRGYRYLATRGLTHILPTAGVTIEDRR